ncbi:MAG: hypothetical protein EOM76_02500 [Sphingobacteriia bacterium]|jgi:hypothetical protein|nr:hypothetical protein [Paludibacteraceae bacterium]NCA79047.1 hypothetical protein [Sphingobacteriia bacterium]
MAEVETFIQNYQHRLIHEKGIYLSVALSRCKILLDGQNEDHCQLSFINYPKFPMKTELLKTEIEQLARSLMTQFHQNRLVINYPDETLMLEADSEKLDAGIEKTGW